MNVYEYVSVRLACIRCGIFTQICQIASTNMEMGNSRN